MACSASGEPDSALEAFDAVSPLGSFLRERRQDFLEHMNRWAARDEELLATFLQDYLKGDDLRLGPSQLEVSDAVSGKRSLVTFAEAPAPTKQAPEPTEQDLARLGDDPRVDLDGTLSKGRRLSRRAQVAASGAANVLDPSRQMYHHDEIPVIAEYAKAAETDLSWVSLIVRSFYFELVSFTVIMLNTIFLGVEVELAAQGAGRQFTISLLNLLFTVFFSLELSIRLLAVLLERRWPREPHWLCFDAFLVISGIIDSILSFTSASTNSGVTSARAMRLFRITRVIRVLRITKLIHFIRDLRVMLHSIVHTLRTVAWAMCLLFTFIYVFAVLFTQANADTESSAEDEFWGSLGWSMMTLLTAVTGGLDWRDPLMSLHRIGIFWYFTFLAYVIFTTFAILNVVTAAFCQGAVEGRMYDREQAVKELVTSRRADLMKATDLFQHVVNNVDDNADGDLTWEEFQEHIRDDSVQALLAMLELDSSDLWSLYHMLLHDSKDGLNVQDFVHGCIRMKGTARSIDVARYNMEAKEQFRITSQFLELLTEELATTRLEVAELSSSLTRSRQPARKSTALSFNSAATAV